MTAILIVNWQVKEGQAAAWAEVAKEFQPIGERLGFQNMRFFTSFGNPTVGPNLVTWAAELENVAVVGAAIDALPADSEVQAWLAGASGAATQVGTQIAAEVVY